MAVHRLVADASRRHAGSPPPRGPRHVEALACAALVAAGLLGCERRSAPSPYMLLGGRIESIQADKSQFVLRPAEHDDAGGESLLVTCFLPGDAEVYIDDRLAPADELRGGDEIEVLGYADADPRSERFVVAFANIRRGAVVREGSPGAPTTPTP